MPCMTPFNKDIFDMWLQMFFFLIFFFIFTHSLFPLIPPVFFKDSCYLQHKASYKYTTKDGPNQYFTHQGAGIILPPVQFISSFSLNEIPGRQAEPRPHPGAPRRKGDSQYWCGRLGAWWGPEVHQSQTAVTVPALAGVWGLCRRVAQGNGDSSHLLRSMGRAGQIQREPHGSY